MFLRLTRHGSVEFDRVFAGRPDDDLFHVAVGSVQQAAFFRGREHGDRSRRTGRAQIRSFQRIDRDVDVRNLLTIGEGAADLLSDVEHGSVVALAFADDDGAVHRDRVHGLAHGLGRDLIAQMAVALAHGARRFDGGVFHHAQELQRQIAFDVFPETFGVRFHTARIFGMLLIGAGFRMGLGSHECSS